MILNDLWKLQIHPLEGKKNRISLPPAKERPLLAILD